MPNHKTNTTAKKRPAIPARKKPSPTPLPLMSLKLSPPRRVRRPVGKLGDDYTYEKVLLILNKASVDFTSCAKSEEFLDYVWRRHGLEVCRTMLIVLREELPVGVRYMFEGKLELSERLDGRCSHFSDRLQAAVANDFYPPQMPQHLPPQPPFGATMRQPGLNMYRVRGQWPPYYRDYCPYDRDAVPSRPRRSHLDDVYFPNYEETDLNIRRPKFHQNRPHWSPGSRGYKSRVLVPVRNAAQVPSKLVIRNRDSKLSKKDSDPTKSSDFKDKSAKNCESAQVPSKPVVENCSSGNNDVEADDTKRVELKMEDGSTHADEAQLDSIPCSIFREIESDEETICFDDYVTIDKIDTKKSYLKNRSFIFGDDYEVIDMDLGTPSPKKKKDECRQSPKLDKHIDINSTRLLEELDAVLLENQAKSIKRFRSKSLSGATEEDVKPIVKSKSVDAIDKTQTVHNSAVASNLLKLFTEVKSTRDETDNSKNIVENSTNVTTEISIKEIDAVIKTETVEAKQEPEVEIADPQQLVKDEITTLEKQVLNDETVLTTNDCIKTEDNTAEIAVKEECSAGHLKRSECFDDDQQSKRIRLSPEDSTGSSNDESISETKDATTEAQSVEVNTNKLEPPVVQETDNSDINKSNINALREIEEGKFDELNLVHKDSVLQVNTTMAEIERELQSLLGESETAISNLERVFKDQDSTRNKHSSDKGAKNNSNAHNDCNIDMKPTGFSKAPQLVELEYNVQKELESFVAAQTEGAQQCVSKESFDKKKLSKEQCQKIHLLFGSDSESEVEEDGKNVEDKICANSTGAAPSATIENSVNANKNSATKPIEIRRRTLPFVDTAKSLNPVAKKQFKVKHIDKRRVTLPASLNCKDTQFITKVKKATVPDDAEKHSHKQKDLKQKEGRGNRKETVALCSKSATAKDKCHNTDLEEASSKADSTNYAENYVPLQPKLVLPRIDQDLLDKSEPIWVELESKLKTAVQVIEIVTNGIYSILAIARYPAHQKLITRVQEQNCCDRAVVLDVVNSSDKIEVIKQKQLELNRDDDVIEVRPEIPVIDLTDDTVTEKALDPFVKKEFNISPDTDAERITLYRSDETINSTLDIQATSVSLSSSVLKMNQMKQSLVNANPQNTESVVSKETSTVSHTNKSQSNVIRSLLTQKTSECSNGDVMNSQLASILRAEKPATNKSSSFAHTAQTSATATIPKNCISKGNESSNRVKVIILNKPQQQTVRAPLAKQSNVNQNPPPAYNSIQQIQQGIDKVLPPQQQQQMVRVAMARQTSVVPTSNPIQQMRQGIENVFQQQPTVRVPQRSNANQNLVPTSNPIQQVPQEMENVTAARAYILQQADPEALVPLHVINSVEIKKVNAVIVKYLLYYDSLKKVQSEYLNRLQKMEKDMPNFVAGEMRCFSKYSNERYVKLCKDLINNLKNINLTTNATPMDLKILVESVMKSLQKMTPYITPSLVYLMLDALMYTEVAEYLKVPFLKSLYEYVVFVTQKIRSVQLGQYGGQINAPQDPFTPEERRTLQCQICEYNRLCWYTQNYMVDVQQYAQPARLPVGNVRVPNQTNTTVSRQDNTESIPNYVIQINKTYNYSTRKTPPPNVVIHKNLSVTSYSGRRLDQVEGQGSNAGQAFDNSFQIHLPYTSTSSNVSNHDSTNVPLVSPRNEPVNMQILPNQYTSQGHTEIDHSVEALNLTAQTNPQVSSVDMQPTPADDKNPYIQSKIKEDADDVKTGVTAKVEDVKTDLVPVKKEPIPPVVPHADSEVIDLTWIDEIDPKQLETEMEYIKKEEPAVEEEADLADEAFSVAPSPADSGMSSPPVQEYDETVFANRTCICGKVAEYVCGCMTVMYCSVDCQATDWGIHREVCQKYKARTSQMQQGEST